MFCTLALVSMSDLILFTVDNDEANGGFERISRIRNWKDIGPGDIKNFLGHLIAMGLLCKKNMGKYWSQSKAIYTSFFGKYMPRNTFQNILSNLHLVDNNTPDKNKDTLYKIRPFVNISLRNFCRLCKPEKNCLLMNELVLSKKNLNLDNSTQ